MDLPTKTGWTLTAAAVMTIAAYGLIPIHDMNGLLVPLLGLFLVGAMFIVNVASRRPAVVAERKWIVAALALLTAANLARLLNEYTGVDSQSPLAALPYVPIILGALALSVVAVRSRTRRRD
jgi:hypothetical protein